MSARPRSPDETYAPAWGQAQAAFLELVPAVAAVRAGVYFEPEPTGGGWFEVPFFGIRYQVGWPHAQVREPDSDSPVAIDIRLLLVHYLLTADGTPMASRWISFREVPGGLGYWSAFQSRSALRLARRFGTDPESFVRAAGAFAGERLAFGDAAFLFRALPRLWMAVVLHVADEEFGANANVLFDASATHYLPTEDLAVLGGLMASRLIRAARA